MKTRSEDPGQNSRAQLKINSLWVKIRSFAIKNFGEKKGKEAQKNYIRGKSR